MFNEPFTYMLYYGLKNKIESSLSADPFPSRRLTETILALNDMAVILTASKNRIVHCSQSVEPILGISSSDVVNGGWQVVFNRIHADDQKLLTKKLHPELRRQLRRLPIEAQRSCSFNYTFRLRNRDNRYSFIALENQGVQPAHHTPSRLYMSVLKNIDRYASRSQISLTILKKKCACGWETLYEKCYPIKAGGFTTRETQIMSLIAQGLSSSQIAAQLFISVETVRAHRKKLMQKAGCRSSAQLISLALREQIL